MAQKWSFKKKFLTMQKIITGFIAIFTLLLLANCTTQNTVLENTQREWILVEFQNFSKETMMNNKAQLNLTKNADAPHKFTANMGCNHLFGEVKFSGTGMVKFAQIASTEMYCDKAMDLEAAFTTQLANMTHYKVEGNYLTLTGSNGAKMKFVAADWD